MRERADAMAGTLTHARRRDWTVIYVNDEHGTGDGDDLLRRARAGAGGDVVRRLEPRDGEALVLKASYSAFEGTSLAALIDRAGVDELVLIGAVTEMCVRESAIDAARLGHRTALSRVPASPSTPAWRASRSRRLDRLSGVRLRPVPGGARE